VTASLADSSTWGNLSQFVGLRRTAGLTLSPDGSRLVAVVQEINDARSEWIPSLWEIPLGGGSPLRLTGPPYGQPSPVFLPDNSLVYVSAQPWPDTGSGGEPALWLRPLSTGWRSWAERGCPSSPRWSRAAPTST